MTNSEHDTRKARIEARLARDFSPVRLEVEDESAQHAGHAGVRDSHASGETHYALLMVSEAFRGQGRVKRSRLVHDALADEFRNGLHAMSMTLRTPDEASSK